MKRSHWVRLAIMGTAPFTLAACDDPKTEALAYESVNECIANKDIPAETCRQEYLAALQSHQNVAPRYTGQPNCEADFGSGKCQEVSNGVGSYFIPAMAGFMIAQALNNSRRDEGGYYGGGGGFYRSQPLYHTRDLPSSWRTANNDVFSGRGRTTVSRDYTAPPQKAITMSRSGFGSMSSARGGWGGS